MKAIFSVVIASATMMRSPSFSRFVESRTTMNSPLPTLRISLRQGIPHCDFLFGDSRDEEDDFDLLKASIEFSMVSNRSLCSPLTPLTPLAGIESD